MQPTKGRLRARTTTLTFNTDPRHFPSKSNDDVKIALRAALTPAQVSQKTASFQAKNAKIVEEFIRTLPSLSARRIAKYRHGMHRISVDLGKPFDQVTKDDLRADIQRVNDRLDYTRLDQAGLSDFHQVLRLDA
jgi:hypothetical protein